MSLARKHRERVLAAQTVTSAPDFGAGDVPAADFRPAAGANTTAADRAAAQIAVRLTHDLRRLKKIKSIDKKIDAKREMLPEYADWVKGLIEADKGVGIGPSAEVAPTVMVWLIDTGDFGSALIIGSFLLRHRVAMPARYNRDVATVLVEEIADAAIKAQNAGDSFPLAILARVDDLTDTADMHDEARAKLMKAMGVELLRHAEDVDAQEAPKALSAKLSAAGIDVANLARHEDRLAMQTHEANQALQKQTAQLEKVAQANRNSQQLHDISAKATGMGVGMIAAGTAAGAPIVIATKQAMTLESAMADVSKVTNMVPAQIEQMSNDFIDMSEKIPMAASELAAIAAAAGAAGVGMDKLGKPMKDQRQQLLQFTNDAAEMGVAFDMTADVAGETMAKWRTAFELPQAGVRALGDSVNALTNTFGGKAANVTDIITRIGPLGKVGGLAAGEIAALGSTLDSIGVGSEIAATGIKNTMLALTKSEAATKKQQGAFQALGLNAVNMAKRMQTDAAGAIVDVMERIGKLDDAKRPAILTELFGSESVAAIAPLLTNLDGLKQRLAMVGDASATAGSMHAEFLNRIAVTEGATGLATNAISGVNITLGKALLPTVVEVAKRVGAAASSFRKWAQENPRLTKAIMLFMAAGSGLLILLGGLGLAFAALTAAAAPLGIALGPLLAIVAAVAALAGVAYLIYANWGSVSPLFASLGASGSAMFSKIQEAAGKFMELWNGPLGDRIRVVITLVQELAGIVAKAIGGTVVAVLNTLMGVASAVFSFIGNAIGLVAAIMTGDFAGAWTAIKGMFSAGADALIAILSGLKAIFMTIGGAIMDGLIAGLKAGWTLVKDTIGDIAGMMPNWVKKILGIHSPSRVFAAIGGFVMGGLDQGLADNADEPLSRVRNLSEQLGKSFGPIAAPGMPIDDPSTAGGDAGQILSRIIDISGQMMRALAAGSVAPAIAAAPVAAQAAQGQASAPTTIHKTYEIRIDARGNAQAQDIADEVRRALEQIERENRGRGFGDD